MKNIHNLVDVALCELSHNKLDELLEKHDQWFLTLDENETEAEVIKERKALKTMNAKVQWILATDPIVSEGGLLDFLFHNDIRWN